MHKAVFGLTFAALAFFQTPALAGSVNIVVDGLRRTYIVEYPAGYPANGAAPVLIWAHGGGGSAQKAHHEQALHATDAYAITVYPNACPNTPTKNCRRPRQSPTKVQPPTCRPPRPTTRRSFLVAIAWLPGPT